ASLEFASPSLTNSMSVAAAGCPPTAGDGLCAGGGGGTREGVDADERAGEGAAADPAGEPEGQPAAASTAQAAETINNDLATSVRRSVAACGSRYSSAKFRMATVSIGMRVVRVGGEIRTGGMGMKHYLLSVYQPDGDPPPPEVLEPIMRDLRA